MQICLLEQSGNPVINGVVVQRRSLCRGPLERGVIPSNFFVVNYVPEKNNCSRSPGL